MTVYLLERAATGHVLTSTIDVRRGKALEQRADDARMAAAGRDLLDWWGKANEEWTVTVWGRPGATWQSPCEVIDLRRDLIRRLTANARASALACWFGVEPPPGTRSTVRDGAELHLAAIARDLVAWYAAPGDRRLKIRLNQAWRNYEFRKSRQEREAKRLGTEVPRVVLSAREAP